MNRRSPSGRPRRRISAALPLALLAALALVAAAGAEGERSTELEVVALVNAARGARGLPALTTDVRLFDAAGGHARWMADNDTLSHTGENGSQPWDRILAAGYQYTRAGETLAAGQVSPQEVVHGHACSARCVTACIDGRCNGWEQSSSHWDTLMDADYRDIGVGYVHDERPGDPYLHWWAVSVGNSASPPTPVGSVDATPTDRPSPTATAVPPTATDIPSPTSTTVPPTATPTRTATSLPPAAIASSTPTATATAALQAGTIVVGRVRSQMRSVWGDTTITVDGQPRAITGEDGWFVMVGLAPGPHTVEAARDGSLTSRGTFEIAGGQVNDLGEALLIIGDYQANGRIDEHDVARVRAALGSCRGDAAYEARMDARLDGCIGDDDVRLVESNLGQQTPVTWAPIPPRGRAR